MTFRPRRAIVTAAGSGIGRATAVVLAASGLDVGVPGDLDVSLVGEPPVAGRMTAQPASMNSGVNRWTQRYTVTWSTVTPRSASSSSTSR
jgi:NAD(P)-dependent dehydrogenase (short-subunit alcohol dehydrogenase family)